MITLEKTKNNKKQTNKQKTKQYKKQNLLDIRHYQITILWYYFNCLHKWIITDVWWLDNNNTKAFE